MPPRTAPTSNGRRASRHKALIAGATGAIGGALAAHLAELKAWLVVGLCRRAPGKPLSGVEYVHADMEDGAACQEALRGQGDITHLFYCGRADHADLGRENVEGNLALLQNVLEATLAASPDLRHVHLVQGGKYYGVHVGPFSTPAREDDFRAVVSNFYYAQEDFLRERAAASRWNWSASRPNTLLHFSPDNPRNLVSTLGAYAAISREMGCALDFPGPEGAYHSLTDMTSTDLLSQAIAWMAMEEQAGNNAFNIANGDLIRWSSFWPKLAAAFDMPLGIVRPHHLAEVMGDKEEVWSSIIKRHALINQPLSRVATWGYGDGTLGRAWDEIMSTTKSKKFGFAGFADSEADFFRILERYRLAKLLPLGAGLGAVPDQAISPPSTRGIVMPARKAVISGASKGIGFAIARRLAADGAEIGLLASHEGRLKEAAERLQKQTGKPVTWHAVDLRTLKGCEEAHRSISQALGGCDILVNSAGATKGGVWPDQPDEEWEDGFALKFYSAVRLARLFWPALTAAKGTVINIVGGFARTPAADFMVGGAVNAALANFSKSLAAKGLQDDVNVNWVHPGLTVTERLDRIFEGRAEQQGKTKDQIAEETIAHEGIRRLGQPEDVAGLVAFLCSAEGRHIQGTAIQIDGGGTPGYY